MKNLYKHLLTIITLAFFVFIAVGSIDESDTVEQNIENIKPAYTVKAQKIYNDFKDNEIAFEQKYKGKVIVVTGVIGAIEKEPISDRIFVKLITAPERDIFTSEMSNLFDNLLGGGDDFEIPLDMDVCCYFSTNQTSSVAQLKKGQSIKIKGKVEGINMGDVDLIGCMVYNNSVKSKEESSSSSVQPKKKSKKVVATPPKPKKVVAATSKKLKTRFGKFAGAVWSEGFLIIKVQHSNGQITEHLARDEQFMGDPSVLEDSNIGKKISYEIQGNELNNFNFIN